ncbi:MAG: glycine-rich protein [Myxococcaceae bacterium]|nr:glycine-rich protein [Myxococcaceae bacterium]
MKIVCESCGAKYSIADEKVAGKVFKIRCKKCSAVIVVKGDQQAEGGEASGAFDYGSDAIWHVVVNGEQQGPFAPRQIGELLAEGKIDWEAYVWREGMEGWQPAKDVEALVKAVMAEAEGGEPAATAARGSQLGGEVFGGSSDMGADPFASSSDDGGLAGVIGQSAGSASATAAGGGADLFADSSRSAFAAAAADDDDDHHGGSMGSAKVTGDSALTGQRNENSVLFSLSNLQALATGSGSAPASGRPKPGMAQGEGSGLIDIRALASATQAVADRPQHMNARDKVEDLLAVGSTGTTFSATSLAAPVAIDKPDHNRTLLYVMAAAIAMLGIGVAYLALRSPAPQPVAQIAQEPEDIGDVENLAVPAARAPKEARTEAPQAAEPTPSEGSEAAEAKAEDSDRPAAGETKEEASKRERSHSTKRHTSDDKAEDKPSKPEPVAAAAVEPAPKKNTSSGDKSLDDLLDTALGGKAKPKPAAAAAPSENLPATPSREDVISAMKGIAPDVTACGKGESGVAMVKVGVAGPTGKVSGADVSGQFAGSPVGSCIAKEVRKAKFPKFTQPTFSFSYPFKL